jgi:DDE_Tnp_1-associated
MWQRLEALPGPRSPRGRIYPLACLIAIALCAFTAAGNDRLTAVGQWIRRAGQADLARLHARGTRSRAGTGYRTRRRSG